MDQYQAIRELWREYRIASESDLDCRLSSYRILFAYHSGKIENEQITYHDTREIFENGRAVGFTGDPRALFEQQNQKLCYELIKRKIVAREPLSIPLIREIHAALSAGTYDQRRYLEQGERPGEFKRHDCVTGVHEVGSAPQRVEDDLAELVAEVNAYDGDDVLKAAAYFHARFEYIHPFADGNGRAGRTLLNYYLMTRGEPPLIVFEEDKKRYYSALEAYDVREDLAPMLAFLTEQTDKTWRAALDLTSGTPLKPRNGLYHFDP